ncbi:hypothetical protein, partial [Alistipes ihumii]|uniref:hypothetical protein n=1 Tax=Alistipes ihumii TaxID=1470347 RepID=UPI003AB3EDB1
MNVNIPLRIPAKFAGSLPSLNFLETPCDFSRKIMYICHFSRRLRKEYSTINSKAMDTDKKDPSVPVEQVNAPGIEDMPQSAPASSEIADEGQPAQDPAPSTEAGHEKRPDAAAAD